MSAQVIASKCKTPECGHGKLVDLYGNWLKIFEEMSIVKFIIVFNAVWFWYMQKYPENMKLEITRFRDIYMDRLAFSMAISGHFDGTPQVRYLALSEIISSSSVSLPELLSVCAADCFERIISYLHDDKDRGSILRTSVVLYNKYKNTSPTTTTSTSCHASSSSSSPSSSSSSSSSASSNSFSSSSYSSPPLTRKRKTADSEDELVCTGCESIHVQDTPEYKCQVCSGLACDDCQVKFNRCVCSEKCSSLLTPTKPDKDPFRRLRSPAFANDLEENEDAKLQPVKLQQQLDGPYCVIGHDDKFMSVNKQLVEIYYKVKDKQISDTLYGGSRQFNTKPWIQEHDFDMKQWEKVASEIVNSSVPGTWEMIGSDPGKTMSGADTEQVHIEWPSLIASGDRQQPSHCDGSGLRNIDGQPAVQLHT